MITLESIVTVIVAGIFALIGAIIGSFMQRRTAHQSWILEKRAEVFSDFLQKLHKSIEEASMYFRQGPEKGLEREQTLLDIYFPSFDYAKVVRLYLKESDRNQFEELTREIYAIHSQKELGDTRLNIMEKKRKELQKLFEEHLKCLDW